MHYRCNKCDVDLYLSAPHDKLECPNNCGNPLIEQREVGATPPLTSTTTTGTMITAPIVFRNSTITLPKWEKEVFDRLSNGEALKYDTNKNPLELLPVEALEAVGEILRHGAYKYEPRNWEKGMKWSRLYGAALRHLFAWWRGEKNDPDSGLSHLAHAACCLMFLLTYEIRGVGDPDRQGQTHANS